MRADVYPNAPKLCVDGDADGDGLDDAVDNDCDGTADEAAAEDVLIWYADADSDGFGNAAATLSSEQPGSVGYLLRQHRLQRQQCECSSRCFRVLQSGRG